MIKVSLVILNWNGKKDTLECIESVTKAAKDGIKLQILVVDNASKDDSVKVIRNKLKKITFSKNDISGEIIKNRANLGFTGGNNVGLKHALEHKADFVILLNNDTIVDQAFLNNFLYAFKKHKKTGIISPKIYFAPGYEFHKDRYEKQNFGKVIWSAGGDIDWDNAYCKNRGVDEIDSKKFKKERQTDFATGACMMIKTKVLKKVGLFDEKYFAYLEDADLSVRVKKAGWNIRFVPNVHIWHKVSQSSAIGSDLNDYFITRNRLLFGMRYAPLRTRFALYRESLRFLISGRKWQKRGVVDFYLGKFGKGSWK